MFDFPIFASVEQHLASLDVLGKLHLFYSLIGAV